VVQIEGIHITDDRGDRDRCGGVKHPLALPEGAAEHAAVVQALIDDLIERGLDPAVSRLFVIGAASVAIHRSSVARFMRPATSWSGCRSPYMPSRPLQLRRKDRNIKEFPDGASPIRTSFHSFWLTLPTRCAARCRQAWEWDGDAAIEGELIGDDCGEPFQVRADTMSLKVPARSRSFSPSSLDETNRI
jgi:hypothetical protein